MTAQSQNQPSEDVKRKKAFIDPTSNRFKIHLSQLARKKRKEAAV